MVKKVAFVAIAALFLCSSLSVSSAEAAPQRLYQDDFLIPVEMLGAANLLFQAIPNLQLPINDVRYDFDVGLCDFFGIEVDVDLFMDIQNSGYSIFFDTSGQDELVFIMALSDWWISTGDFHLKGEDCFFFIEFSFSLNDSDVSSGPNYMFIVAIPYYDPETDKVTLELSPYQQRPAAAAYANFDIDINNFPDTLEDIFQPLIAAWLGNETTDLLLDEDGYIFELLEELLDVYYIRPDCGCSPPASEASTFTGQLSSPQFYADLGIYLLLLGLLLLLKRRNR